MRGVGTPAKVDKAEWVSVSQSAQLLIMMITGNHGKQDPCGEGGLLSHLCSLLVAIIISKLMGKLGHMVKVRHGKWQPQNPTAGSSTPEPSLGNHETAWPSSFLADLKQLVLVCLLQGSEGSSTWSGKWCSGWAEVCGRKGDCTSWPGPQQVLPPRSYSKLKWTKNMT